MAGDSDQWTVWLDQHIAPLILLARQWVPRRDDAEDVVQEAFIRFWRSRHRVSDPAAYFYPCVKRIFRTFREVVSLMGSPVSV